jgi:hypothetical protein
MRCERDEITKRLGTHPQSTIAIFASWSWHITHKPDLSVDVFVFGGGGGEEEEVGGGG